MTTAEIYSEFLSFRDSLIKKAMKYAVYTDSRDNQPFRPVAVLTNPSALTRLRQDLAVWDNYVSTLVQDDPLHFSETHKMFIKPKVIEEGNIKISQNTATSTRLKTKESLITWLNKEIKRLTSINKFAQAEELKEEVKFFESDNECIYRIRSIPYTDSVLVVSYNDERKDTKIRVNEAGAWIKAGLKWSTSKESTGVRSDAIAYSNVEQIPNSLPYSGFLYRESDIIRAKLINSLKTELETMQLTSDQLKDIDKQVQEQINEKMEKLSKK